MKGRKFLVFLFIAINADAQQASIDSLKLNWEKYKLRNGVTVILQPDPLQKEVSVEFWIHTGTKDEAPGKFGFAHFFEHATPYGFTKDTISRNELRSFRTNSNAQTRRDYIRYYVQVKPEGLPLALKYTAERLNADTSEISNEIIERQRANVLNEMNRQEAYPLSSPIATSLRDGMTFGKNSPYGHGSYGSIKENESFTAKNVKTWYKKYFYANNVILFVVGNFQLQDTKLLIEKNYGKMYNREPQPKKNIPVGITPSQRFTLPAQSKPNFLSVTWQIPGWNSTDAEKLQLLAYILDERLNKDSFASVKDRGSSLLFNLYESAGQFGVFASFTSQADSIKIEDYFFENINTILSKGISADELLRAREKAIIKVKGMELQLGFIDSRAELLGEGLLFSNDPDHYLVRLKRQAEITPEDVQAITVKWLKTKGARLLLISSKD